MAVSGIAALLCLLGCLAVGIAGAGAADSTARHAWLTHLLMIPTALYFVSGILFYRFWRKGSRRAA